jgi:hypothetical protein
LVKIDKLDPRPLDEDPKPIEVAFTWHHFGGKFNWSGPKIGAQRKAHGLENQDVS